MNNNLTVTGPKVHTLETPLDTTAPQGDLQVTKTPKRTSTGPTTSPGAKPPSSYKTKDLQVSDKAMGRLQDTLSARSAKKAKFKNPPTTGPERDKVLTEKNKEHKSRMDKFYKEFKSVFKNLGKATKAGGDGGKSLGGSDVSKITGGIGAGTQLVETGFDIYLAKVKVDKAKTDLETVEKFAPSKLKDEETSLQKERDIQAGRLSGKQIEVRACKSQISRASRSLDKCTRSLTETKKEIANVKAKLAALDDNIAFAKEEDVGTSFFKEEKARLGEKLQDLESQKASLENKQAGLQNKIDGGKRRLGKLTQQLKKLKAAVAEIDDRLAKHVSTGRLKGRMAEKDLNSYNDSVPLERAKLAKSLMDGQKALLDIGSITSSSISGSEVALGLSKGALETAKLTGEGFKLGGGVVGVVVGPLTTVINTKDFITDVTDNRTFLGLKKKSTEALKSGTTIKQDDGELLAIAERLRLKQKKQSVDKGLSATKNFFGALGGVGTFASGVATIAGIAAAGVATTATAVAICTPIGWGLAGAAALAAIGYGIYKLARHINSSGIKAALQGTLQRIENEPPGKTVKELGLEGKEAKQMKRVTDKMVAALKSQGITANPGDFTMAEVQNYASKKLLARDTGVATTSLYHRFKAETSGYFQGKGIDKPTPEDFDALLKEAANESPVTSALGLMSKLGLSMNKEEALDLYRDGSVSDGVKFLSKKLKLA